MPGFGHRGHRTAFERLLWAVFRKAGWAVRLDRGSREAGWDAFVAKGDLRYAVVMKQAGEGRRDRMIPLLAEAILRAQAAVRSAHDLRPLAIVSSPSLRPRLVEELLEFGRHHSPDVAVGIVDVQGWRSFAGQGLEKLNAKPKEKVREAHGADEPVELFSDVNQWMLKVWLAPKIPEQYLAAPRGEYWNASELARAAQVSVMSAFRLLRQLESEKFLEPSVKPLRLVRIQDLLRRWRFASLRPVREWPLRFALRFPKGEGLAQVMEFLKTLSTQQPARRSRAFVQPPRMCLGLFAAAKILAVGHVSGVSPHVYVDDLRKMNGQELGLIRVAEGQQADLIVREARARRSVFNGAVVRDGVPVADALQIWLDVVEHSSRGAAQAREIERVALRELFKKRQ